MLFYKYDTDMLKLYIYISIYIYIYFTYLFSHVRGGVPAPIPLQNIHSYLSSPFTTAFHLTLSSASFLPSSKLKFLPPKISLSIHPSPLWPSSPPPPIHLRSKYLAHHSVLIHSTHYVQTILVHPPPLYPLHPSSIYISPLFYRNVSLKFSDTFRFEGVGWFS